MNSRVASAITRCLSAAALGIATTAACAQSYPSKTMRIIAPFSAGGAADLMARYLCEKFPQSMGQPCVVENRTGAGGVIGLEAMLKSEPDGHTLALMTNALSILPGLVSKLPYDTFAEVAPIALVSSTPVMVGVHPSVPAKNFAELIAWVKAENGKVNYTSCAPASPQHLAGEILGSMAGLKWTHVPYKGCGEAMAGVLSGTVPVFISTYAHFLPQVKSGKLRAFVTTGAKRTPLAPEYPTVAESGFPGYEVDVWFGLVGSTKLPAPVITRLNAEVNKILASDLRDKLLNGQYEPIGGTPQRFAELVRTDMAKYVKAIREAGIKPD